jgi:RNA recognition motif-containing protein
MDARLDVGNLADTTSNDDLRQLFTQAGEVALVAVIKDRETGLSTGQALVTMTTRANTRKAISMFDAYRLGERAMTVSLARRRLVRSSGRPRRSQP